MKIIIIIKGLENEKRIETELTLPNRLYINKRLMDGMKVRKHIILNRIYNLRSIMDFLYIFVRQHSNRTTDRLNSKQ